MAMEGSTSSFFPVFIDTNLGTHLSLTINRDDTAAQLKGKVMSEHPRCFPQIGEISIEALKVKNGEIHYHLADSMIVRFAFEHIEGAKFLNIDLVPALRTINNHTQAIMGDDDVQPRNCIPLSINHNASLIPISVPREHENTILPGACEQTPSELETTQLQEQAISGAHVQQSFDNDATIINKNERVELEHKDAAVEPKKSAPLVSNKNEKYQKPNISLLGDEILAEKRHVGKRKHEKGKDVNLDSFHEAAAEFDSSTQDPSDAKLKRKKKKVLSSNDEIPQNNSGDESLHMVDDTAKGNQTTENFVEVMVSNSKDMGKDSEIVVQANSVHSNTPQVEYDKNERVELEHKNAAVELKKDAPLVADKNEKYQKPNSSLLDDDIPSGKDHVGKREHKKDMDVNLDGFHKAAAQYGLSIQDPSNVKLKRKKKKVLSSNDKPPQNNPANESLPKVDGAAKENETGENFVESMVISSNDMGKESEIVVPKEANSLHSNIPQVEYNKNERLEVEHKNAASETKKDAPLVSSKNEEYKKHNTSLHGDEIFSKKDHVGKRKHKKDMDVNFDSFQEAAIRFDSSMQDPSNVRLKRKKKKVVSSNDELPQNVPADESLPKVDDAGKENEATKNIVEVMVSNSENMGKESEIVVPKEANSLHRNITQVESLGQAGVDAKRKRKKKVLEKPPQNKLINNSLDGIDASAQEKPIKHSVGEITNKNVKLGTNFEKSVTHGHDSSGKINAASKEIQAQEIQVQENHEEELIPQNNSVDESLPKVDDATKENQTTEIFEEVMLSKNKDLGRESEIVVPKEANSLHSKITQVESLGPAGVDTKQKRRKKVLEEPPQNKLISNSLGEVNASAQVKSIDENCVEITNRNVKLGKNSEVTDTLGHDSSVKDKDNPNKTTVADSFVHESKIALSPADKKKRRACKNKEKTEPLVQELQSSKHEIVGSSIDQATLNLPKAPSVNQPEILNAGLNGEGAVEDISNEKRPKRSRKKSEKIEQKEATMPSDAQKIVNLTVDQVNENSMKELSDNPTNVMEATIAEAVACDKKPKRSRKRNASIEHEHLTAADGHPVMDTAVQVKPSDQKSKRSKKKSEKANFPSKESSIIKESTKENFKETSTGEIGHTNENSEKVSRTIDKIVSAELDWVNNQIEAQNHIAKKPVGANFSSDVCKNEKAAKSNQDVIKEKTENTDENVESLSGIGDNKTTNVLNNSDTKEVPQADTEKINFMDYFGRSAKQHEMVQEKISRKTKRERKQKTSPHDSTPSDKMLKHEHNLTEKKLQESDSGKQSLDGPALHTSKAQVDAPKKHESKDTNYTMASNNNSGVVPNNLKEGYMARLDASVGSAENGTQNQRITSRRTIKKVQNNSPKSKLSNYHGEMLTPGTIFDDDDANSGSSIDDFIISSKPNPGKTSSGNSSETDDDSDSGSDETSISLGASDDNVFRSAFDNPTKLSRKNEPISTILKSTRSYQRAKLSASQPEFDDIGSQNVDVVFETQPESPEI